MTDLGRDWFAPARLFADGYPEGLTSALRALPAIGQAMRDEIARLAPRTALEVGPGDVPLLDGHAGAVFLDVAPRFLAPLRGGKVVGDLTAAPFATAAFDVVVAADVLTHIVPERRPRALAEIVRVGRAAVIFVPEPGTPEVARSPVKADLVIATFTLAGWRVDTRRFVTRGSGGEFPMAVVTARRP